MTTKEKIQFIKRLSFLVRANVPLEVSLEILVKQKNSRTGRKIIKSVLENVKSGKTLSESLEISNKSFDGIIINMLRMGEESGTLPESLEHIAHVLEKNRAIRSKIIQALTYPVVIIGGITALVIFLVLYIFPKITPVFASLKIPLPLATKILISTSYFLRTNPLWILVSVTAFVIIFYLFFRFSVRFKLFVAILLIRVPLIGSLIQTHILAKTSLFLGILLASNTKLDEALKLVTKSIQHPIYRNFFELASESVSGGVRLSEICSKNEILFPAIFSNMIAVGEMSGNFSDVLKDLTLVYESELESTTRTFTQMIEPVLMIFMSVLVGFVAISIITPLYSITGGLRQ